MHDAHTPPDLGRFRSRPPREKSHGSEAAGPAATTAAPPAGRKRLEGRAAACSAWPDPRPPSPPPFTPPPTPTPTPTRPSEAAGLAHFQASPVGHTSGPGCREGAVGAVETVASRPPGSPGRCQHRQSLRGLTHSPELGRLPGDGPRRRPAKAAPRGTGAPRCTLTSNVSKTHVRRRSTEAPAPLAWPGPPSRSAPLSSAAYSSTRRTSARGSSPTRQGLLGSPRPFCDARGA